MGTKIAMFKYYYISLFLILACSNAYSIKNGYYKANIFNKRYCYIRNDTIWFNYDMPVGEGYIRFAKGLIQKDGTIRLLKIEDKIKTRCDTICINHFENVSQLKLNVYDFRTEKEVVKPISYMIHQDYTYQYDKRIFLTEPFQYVNGCYLFDYSSMETPKAILSFDYFKNDHDLSSRIECVYLEIRKNEQAKYKITLAPKVTYSEHFSNIGYSYQESQNKLTLFFTRKIHGFPDYAVDYLPVEHPDMDSFIRYVYSYYTE